jgi:hypothetical protein
MTDESERYQKHIPPFLPEKNSKKTYAGDALMNAGYTFPWVSGDYPAMQLYFRKVK